MPKYLYLILVCCSALTANAQNVGINNANPKVALDVQGAIATRAFTITPVAGNAVNIPANASLVVISGGAATATINGLFPGAYVDGQRMVIYNTNAAGFDVLFFGSTIPMNQAREFICRNPGGWSLLSGSLGTEGWSTKGNSGTIDGVSNLLGTTDGKPVRFIENGQNSGIMDAARSSYYFGGGSGNNLQAAAYANSGFGYLTLNRNTTGRLNTAIGSQSLADNKEGNYITAVGAFALEIDTAAFETVAIGAQSLRYNQSRFGNTGVGTNTLYWNTFTNSTPILPTEGLHNTAMGHSALFNNRRGSGGIAIGYQAAFTDTAANGIVAIGRAALYRNNGIEGNIAIGDSALYYNGTSATLINHAAKNVAIGSKAMLKNFIGDNNTAIGYHALQENQTGSSNTAVGSNALPISKGFDNTAIGANALYRNETGYGNTALGSSALQNLRSSASFNVAIGISALQSNNTGSGNVAIGSSSLENSIGRDNVAIGNSSGANERGSNKLYIENSDNDSLNALIYGDFAADSLLLNAKTVVKNNAVVRGFTKLGGYGAEVPSIKMKKLFIPVGPAIDGLANYPFGSGITDAKVLGVQVLMNYDAGTSKIPPSYRDAAGYEYNIQIQFNGITIINKPGNSANIGGKRISVLVTYEE